MAPENNGPAAVWRGRAVSDGQPSGPFAQTAAHQNNIAELIASCDCALRAIAGPTVSKMAAVARRSGPGPDFGTPSDGSVEEPSRFAFLSLPLSLTLPS